MCIERAVVEDLCELYPKTAMRLKWLALERHKELIAFKKFKDKAQTLVPIQWREKLDAQEVIEQVKQMDNEFKDYKKKNGKEYDFGVKIEEEDALENDEQEDEEDEAAVMEQLISKVQEQADKLLEFVGKISQTNLPQAS